MNIQILELMRHRLVRIWQSYFPKPLTQEDHQLVHDITPESLIALFYSQPLCDQRHGLLVLEKCKVIFGNETNRDVRPTQEELVVASFFHDVAKKFCKFSVTQRVIFATALIFIPNRNYDYLRKSKCKIVRRIGIYVDHAQLSFDVIEPQVTSDFVKNAILYHHGIEDNVVLGERELKQIELFIQADTL